MDVDCSKRLAGKAEIKHIIMFFESCLHVGLRPLLLLQQRIAELYSSTRSAVFVEQHDEGLDPLPVEVLDSRGDSDEKSADQIPNTHTRARTQTHTCTHTRARARTHSRTHIHMFEHARVRAHTHALARAFIFTQCILPMSRVNFTSIHFLFSLVFIMTQTDEF